jgi:hypothetical protein
MARNVVSPWEYAVMVYDESSDRWTVNGDPSFIPEPAMVTALNAMGARGWEMCAYEPYAKYLTPAGEQSRPMSFYFKRPATRAGR